MGDAEMMMTTTRRTSVVTNNEEVQQSLVQCARLDELANALLAELARVESEVENAGMKLAATSEDEYGVLRAECRVFAKCFNALLAGKGRRLSRYEERNQGEGDGPLAAHLHELFTGIISKRIASVRQYVTHRHTNIA